MTRGRGNPEKTDRVPKPIAPNPWRRGRRRSGNGAGATAPAGPPGHGNVSGNGADAGDAIRSNNHGTADSDNRHQPHSPRPPLSPASSTRGDRTREEPGSLRRPTLAGIERASGARGQVIGLFADRASAESACRALADRGYREDAIRLLISDRTCERHFSDYARAALHRPAAQDEPGRAGAAWSHRPKPCPARLDVAVNEEPGEQRETLAEFLTGSGIPDDRIAEYESALREGAVLLAVVARSADDARLIEIEWRRSYRAEKVFA